MVITDCVSRHFNSINITSVSLTGCEAINGIVTKRLSSTEIPFLLNLGVQLWRNRRNVLCHKSIAVSIINTWTRNLIIYFLCMYIDFKYFQRKHIWLPPVLPSTAERVLCHSAAAVTTAYWNEQSRPWGPSKLRCWQVICTSRTDA